MFKTNSFKAFDKKVWLATPTPHPEMMEYIQKAYDDNWGTKDNRNNHIAFQKFVPMFVLALDGLPIEIRD